jgi:CubicO group peptidase (beta-lactamase class C family)
VVVLGFYAYKFTTRKIHESPRYIIRHIFPVDSIFMDLDKVVMGKKAKIIDSAFTAMQTKAGFNGTVMYSERGRLVFKKAYGYDDFKARKKLSTRSAFQLASVSKMFTAMSIMILKEEGLLNYDDSIKKFIPELPYTGLTIRNLLNHRSGLPDYMHFADEYLDQSVPMTNEDMIRVMAIHQPKRYFTSGNGFDYCNSNYVLLASIVERIAKKPFETFVREKIFDPLEMNDSFIYRLEPGKEIPEFVPVGVSGHHGRRGTRVEPNFYQNGIVGDKGVYSTVEDLFKWDQALYKATLVSDATLKEAFTKGSPGFKEWRDNYGFGWRLKADRVQTVYHYGWWKGFRSYFIRDMYTEKTLIVLTNTTRSLPSGALYDLIDDKRHDLGPVCPYAAAKKKKGKSKN